MASVRTVALQPPRLALFFSFSFRQCVIVFPACRFRLHMRWWLLWTVQWQVDLFKWAAWCGCCRSCCCLIHFCVWIAKRRTYFTLLFGGARSVAGFPVCLSVGRPEFWVKQVTLSSDPVAFQVVPHIWYMFRCRAWVNCVTGIVNFRHIFQGFVRPGRRCDERRWHRVAWSWVDACSGIARNNRKMMKSFVSQQYELQHGPGPNRNKWFVSVWRLTVSLHSCGVAGTKLSYFFSGEREEGQQQRLN